MIALAASLKNKIKAPDLLVLHLIRCYQILSSEEELHKGITQIPKGEPTDIEQSDFSIEDIRSRPVLGGLHNHYYRDVA